MDREWEFPQFRCYAHRKNWFRIVSASAFEEIQVIGSRYAITHVAAKTFPDHQFIHDLLQNVENRWVVVDQARYEAFLDAVRNTKTPMGDQS